MRVQNIATEGGALRPRPCRAVPVFKYTAGACCATALSSHNTMLHYIMACNTIKLRRRLCVSHTMHAASRGCAVL